MNALPLHSKDGRKTSKNFSKTSAGRNVFAKHSFYTFLFEKNSSLFFIQKRKTMKIEKKKK